MDVAPATPSARVRTATADVPGRARNSRHEWSVCQDAMSLSYDNMTLNQTCQLAREARYRAASRSIVYTVWSAVSTNRRLPSALNRAKATQSGKTN
jgi:hypothetical protein